MKKIFIYLLVSIMIFTMIFSVNIGSAVAEDDVFLPYINEDVPKILTNISKTETEGIIVERFVFESITVGDITNKAYAIFAYPKDKGNLPAVMYLHGGNNVAEEATAVAYAKHGYACLTFDIPGLANPTKAENSEGMWKDYAHGWNEFDMSDDVKYNTVFQAVVGSIQAFNILSSKENVDREKIGVAGISWGGYLTTMVSSLLGDRVKAAYSIYGSGFYDLGSYFRGELLTLGEEDQGKWLERYDAGRRAGNITAPYFMAASAMDHYFWPTAVVATYNEVTSEKNIMWGTERSHSLNGIEDADKMQYKYFDRYLKGEGEMIPQIKIEGYEKQKDGSIHVTFIAESESVIKSAKLYYADPVSWASNDNDQILELYRYRVWKSYDATSKDGVYTVSIPKADVSRNSDWFISITNASSLTIATVIHSVSDAAEDVLTPVEPEVTPISMKLVIDSNEAIVNGEKVYLDVPAMVVNDRTLTPARFVAENLGATVEWEGATQTVTITKDENTIILVIDSNEAMVNGEKVYLDVPAQVINDRTLTPARFVAENLGAKVGWDGATNTVTIDGTK